MSKKSELVDRIKRRLGHPMVKVEVHDDQITDNINYARNRFIKYAAGQATQEVYFTMMLSGGQYLYDMPDGTVEVISYDSGGSAFGGINTLFTMGNYMYSQGMFDQLMHTGESGYSLIGYHIARDFLETLERYNPDSYRFKYHRTANLLEIQPPPETGNSLILSDGEYDSPGFILVRATMIDGATLPDWEGIDSLDNNLYEAQWIEMYSTALTKQTLGLVRRKFASFTALGNQGTALDGGDLIGEAKEEVAQLEADLLLKEQYTGWPILIGSLLLFLINSSYLLSFMSNT